MQNNRLILIITTSVLALLGFTSCFVQGSIVAYGYTIFSSLLIGAVAIGGMRSYNSQTQKDIRDIYRERIAIMRETIDSLREDLIDLHKEKTNLKRRLEEKTAATKTNSRPAPGTSPVGNR